MCSTKSRRTPCLGAKASTKAGYPGYAEAEHSNSVPVPSHTIGRSQAEPDDRNLRTEKPHRGTIARGPPPALSLLRRALRIQSSHMRSLVRQGLGGLLLALRFGIPENAVQWPPTFIARGSKYYLRCNYTRPKS